MASGKQPLVLVAEDEDSVRVMLGVALRAAGFDSILCVDGRDALDRLEAGLVPDVVLIDIRMPRMGGVELLSAIRSETKWDPIPLVAMSAYSDQPQRQQIADAGADAFLPKPFTIADLRQVLGGLSPRSTPAGSPVESGSVESGLLSSGPVDSGQAAPHAHHRDLRSQGELMRAFRAAPLFELASLLGGMQEALPSGASAGAGDLTLPWRLERLRRIVPTCIPLCEEYGLAATAITLRRIEGVLTVSDAPGEATVSGLVGEALGRLTDELSLQSILFLDHAEAGLYTGRAGVDQEVLRAFPSARDDLTEAAKCLALGRGTATVFHCMRVLQVMLRAVAWDLGDPDLDAAEDVSWSRVLDRFERELAQPVTARSAAWSRRGSLYPEATRLLHSLADGWRSSTLRPAALYTEEQARTVWAETQALLRLLASGIAEPGAAVGNA